MFGGFYFGQSYFSQAPGATVVAIPAGTIDVVGQYRAAIEIAGSYESTITVTGSYSDSINITGEYDI